ncbi:hypothetical protein, partial [Elioraea tepidiphila]|uniref:hypothetical protein n=1 Tax=Elioraea tepidiphila TaxID=457934 RepID=UPI002FDA131C
MEGSIRMRGALAQVMNWFGTPARSRPRSPEPAGQVLFDDRPAPAPTRRRLDPVQRQTGGHLPQQFIG